MLPPCLVFSISRGNTLFFIRTRKLRLRLAVFNFSSIFRLKCSLVILNSKIRWKHHDYKDGDSVREGRSPSISSIGITVQYCGNQVVANFHFLVPQMAKCTFISLFYYLFSQSDGLPLKSPALACS